MRVFDAILRAAGAVLATLMAAQWAVLIATATPRFWLIPVAGAVAGNVFLVWFAQYTVDRRWGAWIPGGVWCLVMLILIAPTGEGDQIANSGTGLATFAAGALAMFMTATLSADTRRRSVRPNAPTSPL